MQPLTILSHVPQWDVHIFTECASESSFQYIDFFIEPKSMIACALKRVKCMLSTGLACASNIERMMINDHLTMPFKS
jgi:hypothetical protein